ncbi:MAG: hypothetical protein WKG07_34680 [Hymenobacter sp.]
MGQAGAYVLAVLIMLSTFGANNGIILSGARAYFAMAKDGLFSPRLPASTGPGCRAGRCGCSASGPACSA